jgi:two-component system chemotaxis sensor kinase CheA
LEQLLAQLSAVRHGQPLSRSSEDVQAAPAIDIAPSAAEYEEPLEEKDESASRHIEATPNEFILEAKEHLTGMVHDLLELEKNEDRADSARIGRLFRAVHSVKGGAGFFGCQVIESLAHAMEEVLEGLRGREAATIEPALVDALLAGTDRTLALLDDVRRSNRADVADILERLKIFSRGEATEPLARPKPQMPSIPSAAASVGEIVSSAAERVTSLRVPVPLVDRLMTLAGELVLARNQALRSLDGGTEAMRPVLQKLDAVTTELQGAVTQTRMQPVGNLFAKFPRLVRDLARQLNKRIELEISGTEVELDKSVLEELSDPLTHLVRNACDHGLETPAERQSAGKPPTGKISLSASQIGGQICIEVRDDGRGLDPRRIKNKALQAGLGTEEELARSTEKDLLRLILLPGFSTAREVTDVSGRGVGMDVVKTNLDRLGGTLEIDSSPGTGTAFELRVPLTLAIIPCLIIGSGGRSYALPQKDLEELVCLHPDLTSMTIEATVDQELVRLRNRLLPLVRLEEVFSRPSPFESAQRREIANKYHGKEMPATLGEGACLPQTEKNHSSAFTLLAVVKAGSRRFGIIVDEILKSEEIVVKPMHGSLKPLGCFSGATILGDGQVALIVNVEGIARHAGVRLGERLAERGVDSGQASGEGSAMLLFTYGPEEQFAVPLVMIRRLAMVERERIERVGGQEFITMDGVAVSILRLDRILPVSPESGSGMLFMILPKNLSRPVGVLATSIIDTETLPANFAVDAYRADGVVGTAIVRGRMTLLLDPTRLAEIAESATRKPAAQAVTPASKGRILYVDDAQFFRELAGGYLKNANYEVATAVNGAEALRILETEAFDLVVSDIEMPVMDGWTFAQSVRQNVSWNTMPLLALTTLNSTESREKAKQCGYDGYQVKLDRGELLAAVEELLELRRYRQAGSTEERRA